MTINERFFKLLDEKKVSQKDFAKQRAFRSKPSAVGKIEKLIRQHR